MLRTDCQQTRLDWDDPRLVTGFHEPEPGARHRWMDGEAVLLAEALATLGGRATVALHVSMALRCPQASPTEQFPLGRANRPGTQAA